MASKVSSQNCTVVMQLSETQSLPLPFQPFALAFSSPFSSISRIAVCSFDRGGQNWLKTFRIVGPSALNETLAPLSFPQTCAIFSPFAQQVVDHDHLLTAAESIKIWEVSPTNLQMKGNFAMDGAKDPLTSADWSVLEERVAIAGSASGEVFAVDIEVGTCASRIVAHDHPVHDVRFCGPTATFVTAGFDGSVRFFDLRDLESSFVYYQSSMPLLRIETSGLSPYFATFSKGSRGIIIDERRPGLPCAVIKFPSDVTAMKWLPMMWGRLLAAHTTGEITCTELSDGQASVVATGVANFGTIIQNMAVSQRLAAVATTESISIAKVMDKVSGHNSCDLEAGQALLDLM